MSGSPLEKNYAGIFGARMGFGSRPAILVIDFVRAYTVETSPFFAPSAHAAAKETATLLAAARGAQVPVVFTIVQFHASGLDGGLFVLKIPIIAELFNDGPMNEIVPELERRSEELLLTKNYASAFFGTSLASTLTAAGVDTLILAGCSTSGCVRATAVDALQHGFRCIVPLSCVADRHSSPHEASLFDINAKYGDVVPLKDVVGYLERLRSTIRRGAE